MTFDAVCKPAYTPEMAPHERPLFLASASAPRSERVDHTPDTKPNNAPKIAPFNRLEVVASTTSTTRSDGPRSCKGIGAAGRFGSSVALEARAAEAKARVERERGRGRCAQSERCERRIVKRELGSAAARLRRRGLGKELGRSAGRRRCRKHHPIANSDYFGGFDPPDSSDL